MDPATCLALALVLLSAEEAIASRGNNTGLADSSQPIDSALSPAPATPSFGASPVTDARSSRTERGTHRRFPAVGESSPFDPEREQMNETDRTEISTVELSAVPAPVFPSTSSSAAARSAGDDAALNGQHLLFFVKVWRNMTELLRFFNATYIRFDVPEQNKVHRIFENGSIVRSVNKSGLMGDAARALRLQFILDDSSELDRQVSATTTIQYTDGDIDVVRLQQDIEDTDALTTGKTLRPNDSASSGLNSLSATPLRSATTRQTGLVASSFPGLPVMGLRRPSPLTGSGLLGRRRRRSPRGGRRRDPRAGLPSPSKTCGPTDAVPSHPALKLQEVERVDLSRFSSKGEIYHRIAEMSNGPVTEATGAEIGTVPSLELMLKTRPTALLDTILSDTDPTQTVAIQGLMKSDPFSRKSDASGVRTSSTNATMRSARSDFDSTNSGKHTRGSAEASRTPKTDPAGSRRVRRGARLLASNAPTPHEMAERSVTAEDQSRWDPTPCPSGARVQGNLQSGPASGGKVMRQSGIDANKAPQVPCERPRNGVQTETVGPSTVAVASLPTNGNRTDGDSNS